MFYADFVLSKKGPLSKVWLAAHWEKKLSKAQIFETDVDEAVSEIMQPSQKLALRTTGHLLLGICRVYSRKTKYLLADCNEAFLKIKLAFRNGALDEPNPVLPTFTIQDIYGEFGDNILPEFDDEELKHAPICQSRIDDITLKEDFPQKFDYNVNDPLEEDDFGDDGAVGMEEYQRMFDGAAQIDLMEELNGNGRPETPPSDGAENNFIGREREATPSLSAMQARGNTIFGDDDLYVHHDESMEEDDQQDYQNNVPTIPALVEDVQMDISASEDQPRVIEEIDFGDQPVEVTETASHEVDTLLENPIRETPDRANTERPPSPTSSIAPSMVMVEQDTVESYYERQAQKRAQQTQQNARKRRMDDIRMITGDEMKANMADYSDTLTNLDMAPPTKKGMVYNRRSKFEFMQYFHAMHQFTKSKTILRTYQANLTIKKQDDTEKIEKLREALGLRDIGEAELQMEQAEMNANSTQEDLYTDDFDYVAPIDLDNFDHLMDIPRPIDEELGRILENEEDELPARNPLSPFNTISEDDDGTDMSPDTRRKDEKDEQEADDDNRWSKRTHALLQTITHKLNNADGHQIELDDLMKKNTSRKIAAAKFYSLLCLKKNQCVEVTQSEPYGEIKIKPGANIDLNLI